MAEASAVAETVLCSHLQLLSRVFYYYLEFSRIQLNVEDGGQPCGVLWKLVGEAADGLALAAVAHLHFYVVNELYHNARDFGESCQAGGFRI